MAGSRCGGQSLAVKPIAPGTSPARAVHTCPHDAVPLIELRHKAVIIRRCPRCGGVWVPSETVVAVLGSIPKSVRRLTRATRSCPDDYTPLSVLKHKGVAIDLCQSCGGVWLDRGELDQLLRKKSRSGYLEATVDGADLISAIPDLLCGAGELAGEVAGAIVSAVAEALSGL